MTKKRIHFVQTVGKVKPLNGEVEV